MTLPILGPCLSLLESRCAGLFSPTKHCDRDPVGAARVDPSAGVRAVLQHDAFGRLDHGERASAERCESLSSKLAILGAGDLARGYHVRVQMRGCKTGDNSVAMSVERAVDGRYAIARPRSTRTNATLTDCMKHYIGSGDEGRNIISKKGLRAAQRDQVQVAPATRTEYRGPK